MEAAANSANKMQISSGGHSRPGERNEGDANAASSSCIGPGNSVTGPH